MKLQCRACQEWIPAQNIHLGQMVAKCDACHAVFGFTHADLGAAAPAPPVSASLLSGGQKSTFVRGGDSMFSVGERPFTGSYGQLDRGEIPLPPGVTIVEIGREFTLHRAWYGCAAWVFLLVATVWCTLSFGIAGAALWGELEVNNAKVEEPFYALIPALFSLPGLGLGYFALCSFVNSTTVRVYQGDLHVSHGPLPWPGSFSVPVNEIVQFYCREVIHRSKKGNTTYTYNVEFMRRNHARETLLDGLQDVGQALYIEQQLERRLGLEDTRVAGEVPRW